MAPYSVDFSTQTIQEILDIPGSLNVENTAIPYLNTSEYVLEIVKPLFFSLEFKNAQFF